MENSGGGAWKQRGTGVLAFVIVLLLMPLGHALMVLLEMLGAAVFTSALILGILGVVLLWWGVARPMRDLHATLLGALGGVLVWTGWVEFSFVWIARKLSVQPLMENGEVATKPEYLVMLGSIGLLGMITLLYLFTSTRCPYFSWFQKRMGIFHKVGTPATSQRPLALITFMEMVMLIWTFYVVLLVCYDKDIAGDRHPITWITAFGSLAWSIWLFARLVRIKSFDHAIRYAIPTVIIFWNFVEILGRWNLFKEIWIHPTEHWMENGMLLAMLIGFSIYFVVKGRKDRQRRSRASGKQGSNNGEKESAPRPSHLAMTATR